MLILETQLIEDAPALVIDDVCLDFSPEGDFFLIDFDVGEDPENLEGELIRPLFGLTRTDIWDVSSFRLVFQRRWNGRSLVETHLLPRGKSTGEKRNDVEVLELYRSAGPLAYRVQLDNGRTLPITLPIPRTGIQSHLPMAISSNKVYFAWWADKKIFACTFNDGRLIGSLQWKESFLDSQLAISPNGKYLLIEDKSLWNITANKVETLDGITPGMKRLGRPCFSSTGDLIAMYMDGLRIWDTKSNKQLAHVPDVGWDITWSPVGYFVCKRFRSGDFVAIYANGDTGSFTIPKKYAPEHNFFTDGDDRDIKEMIFSPDGRIMATLDTHWILAFWGIPGSGSNNLAFPTPLPGRKTDCPIPIRPRSFSEDYEYDGMEVNEGEEHNDD